MTKAIALVAALAALLAACGGGGDDGGNGGSSGGGTAAMAAGFDAELVKIKECVQGEINGTACTINFLQDPVTRMCSDVRTGKTNAQFPNADLTKFSATCDDWKNFLSLDAATKITTLDKMIAGVGALK